MVYTVFFVLLLVVTVLYLLQTFVIYRGTQRLDYHKTEALPTISVLVALRNEEEALSKCLSTLVRLDYPEGKLEIVLINDRSTDRTAELIDDAQNKYENVKAVHISKGIPGLSGKANAIAHGIRVAANDLILVTDGDCQVPESWARTHASYYDPEVGLVGGFTLLDRKNDGTPLFGKIQSLDWAYLLSIGTGAIGYGRPLSVLGNNFSFRKKAYEEVGGYQEVGFTIIEDFALMKTLLKKTRWQVRYPIDKRMLVYSYPMPNLRAFHEQRKRWSAGGKEVGWYGKFLMTVSWLSHALVVSGLLTGTMPAACFGASFLLAAADFCLLFRTTGLVGRRDLLKGFPLWEIFYFVYTLFFAPVLLFPTRITWKNISYSWKFNWQLKRMTELQK